MNMQQMIKQAQKMLEQLQKEKETTVVEATAGGGMISVKMNGNKQLLSIQVDPEVFSGGDREMLQDLIVAAVNDANRKVEQTVQQKLSSVTGGLGLPAGLKLPF